MTKTINIVLKQIDDGPCHEFVEIEDETGKSISLGEWSEQPDGFMQISIPLDKSAAEIQALKSELEVLHLEVSRLNAALMAEKSYSTHYETKFHYVSAECADLASSHVATVGDLMQPQASKERSDTAINFNQEHKA